MQFVSTHYLVNSPFHFCIAVKIHRSFIHVVLALLLLASQQLGLIHLMEHLDSSRQHATVNATQLSVSGSEVINANKAHTQKLLDLSCDQCSALAQLATALPVAVLSPSPVLPANFIAGIQEDSFVCSQTQCGYLSRAPPVLA